MKDLMIKTEEKLEVARAKYQSALTAFHDLKFELQRSDTDGLFGRTTILNRDLDDAVFVIEEASEQIGWWKQVAKTVNMNIDDYSTENHPEIILKYLEKYEGVREYFKTGLVDLKNFAENYLD